MSVAAKRIRRPLVLLCVLLTMFMAAIEVTIVATAMPQIVGQLGGFSLYSWVFAAVLLAQTATTVMFGKLADLYGRKPVMISGISIFLVGSLLCGLSWSMPSLILFRLIQGLGAGAMQPVAMTVIGDIYAPHERAKIQGFLAAVWGASAIIGPLAGGFIVEHWTWHWIFWINIPVGLATIGGVLSFLHENVEHKKRAIDYGGAILVSVAIVSLLLILTFLGQQDVDTFYFILFGTLLAASVPLLLWQEKRAKEPMIALGLWSHRVIASTNGATFAAGAVFMGVTTFLPVYVQAVMGRSATVAGLTLTMMAFGWPIATIIAQRTYGLIGMRGASRLGGLLIFAGTLLFLNLKPDSSPWTAAFDSLVTGFGMGFLMVTCVVMVQGSVDWSQRGSATASNIFSRTLGNTLGASILGGVLNLSLRTGPGAKASVSPDDIRQLLQQPTGAIGRGLDASVLQTALAHGLHNTFVGMAVIGLMTILLAGLIPARELHQLSGGIPTPKRPEANGSEQHSASDGKTPAPAGARVSD